MVEVMLWSEFEVPHGTDADIGVAYAKLGYPVAVRIVRGKNSQMLHLSLDESRALCAGLAPINALK